jgi:hypothetical protein
LMTVGPAAAKLQPCPLKCSTTAAPPPTPAQPTPVAKTLPGASARTPVREGAEVPPLLAVNSPATSVSVHLLPSLPWC